MILARVVNVVNVHVPHRAQKIFGGQFRIAEQIIVPQIPAHTQARMIQRTHHIKRFGAAFAGARHARLGRQIFQHQPRVLCFCQDPGEERVRIAPQFRARRVCGCAVNDQRRRQVIVRRQAFDDCQRGRVHVLNRGALRRGKPGERERQLIRRVKMTRIPGARTLFRKRGHARPFIVAGMQCKFQRAQSRRLERREKFFACARAQPFRMQAKTELHSLHSHPG